MNSINQQRAAGLQLPADSAGQAALAKDALSALVDEEILEARPGVAGPLEGGQASDPDRPALDDDVGERRERVQICHLSRL